MYVEPICSLEPSALGTLLTGAGWQPIFQFRLETLDYSKSVLKNVFLLPIK